jgi:hypothetical protein
MMKGKGTPSKPHPSALTGAVWLDAALVLNSGFFLIGALLLFTLPETKNMERR